MNMKTEKAQWLYQQPEKYKQKNPTRYVKALETLGKTEDLRSWSDYLGTNYSQAVKGQDEKLKGFKRQLKSATPSMRKETQGFKRFVGAQYDPRTGQNMTDQLYGTRQQSLADVIGAEKDRLTADALTKETEANVAAAAYERALQEQQLKQQAAEAEAQLTGYYTPPALEYGAARARAFADIETQLGRKINPGEAGLVEERIKSYTTPSTTPTLDYLTTMASMQKSSSSRGPTGPTTSSEAAYYVDLISKGQMTYSQVPSDIRGNVVALASQYGVTIPEEVGMYPTYDEWFQQTNPNGGTQLTYSTPQSIAAYQSAQQAARDSSILGSLFGGGNPFMSGGANPFQSGIPEGEVF